MIHAVIFVLYMIANTMILVGFWKLLKRENLTGWLQVITVVIYLLTIAAHIFMLVEGYKPVEFHFVYSVMLIPMTYYFVK